MTRVLRRLSPAMALILWGLTGSVIAQVDTEVQSLITDQLRNDESAFSVRVSVDRRDHTYRIGEAMTVTARSSEDGFLYVLQLQADGKVVSLFPNQFDRDNAIAAGQAVTLGGSTSRFRLRIAEPLGTETLKAIVSRKPLSVGDLKHRFKSIGTEISPITLRRVYVEELEPAPAAWAEHQVQITTVSADHDFTARRHRRVALCIGINQFRAAEVSDLSVCVQDAQTVAESLRSLCQFDEIRILTDATASRENIQTSIRHWLTQATSPGDDIVIYWSGHGARCPDDNGDELDEFDEVFIAADTQVIAGAVNPSTAITDDAFGRWIQELSGRRIFIVLDTCHAGGMATEQTTTRRGLSEQPAPVGEWSFLDSELVRARDVGQRNVAMLSSSTASQVSFERREADLSVMTHSLIQAIDELPAKTSLAGIHKFVSTRVRRYVSGVMPGRRQTPQFVDQLADPFFLKSSD